MNLVDDTRLVLVSLRALRIPYALGGALAVNAWVGAGAIRPTYDIDVHARVSDADIARLCARLGRAGRTAIYGGALLLGRGRIVIRRVAIVVPPETEVDFVMARGPYGAASLAHRLRTEFEGTPAHILAPEDVLIFKAIADRDRDHADVARVIAARGADLDLAYLERWARRLRVWTRLARRLRR